MTKIRVLIIDDSALVRQVMTEMLTVHNDIEVVGTAADPLIARKKIKILNPDVVTLDINMPNMDGLTFLEKMMRLRPMPVVMVSTLTKAGADETLRALALGAIDFLAKPEFAVREQLPQYSEALADKIRTAAQAQSRVARVDWPVGKDLTKTIAEIAARRKTSAVPNKGALQYAANQLIAIGASTGGTEAIKYVLALLPNNLPPVVMTQHIPAGFSTSFAESVNQQSQLTVIEVQQDTKLQDGWGYIAPGDRHMEIERRGADWWAVLKDGDPVNRHKPSVDVMFRSLANSQRAKIVAALLTGMGVDGAQGMKEILSAGGKTIAQDEHTSVVWGMPGAAVKLDAAQHVLPLKKIAGKIVELLE